MSIRPSGKKAIRQGRLKVATCVIVNGRSASGFSVPALTWALAVPAPSVNSSTELSNDFIVLPVALHITQEYAGLGQIGCPLEFLRCTKAQPSGRSAYRSVAVRVTSSITT